MLLSVLGIDVAKLKFNVCLLREDGKLRHRVFPNTAAGFIELLGVPHWQSDHSFT